MNRRTPRLRRIRPGSRPRTLALTAGLLACGLVAAACGSSSPAAGGGSATGSPTTGSPTTAAAASSNGSSNVNVSNVTLNIGDQAGSGAETLLTAAGLINKLPFKVKWDDFTSGPPILQAESGGSIDVGGVGNAPPVFAAAGGEKIAVVAALQADPSSTALLVPKSSPITSVSQLKGKKIAVAQGSSANYNILAVLNKARINVKDVDLDYLQPAEGLAALTSGSVDAWDVWSPFIEQAVAKDGARVLVTGKPYGQQYSFEVASRSALANPAKAAAIRDYVRILDQAYRWAAKHTAQWGAVWGQATGFPTSIMTAAAADDSEVPVPITSTVVNAEQSLVSAFSKAGLIPKSFSFAPYSYTGFNSLFSTSS